MLKVSACDDVHVINNTQPSSLFCIGGRVTICGLKFCTFLSFKERNQQSLENDCECMLLYVCGNVSVINIGPDDLIRFIRTATYYQVVVG